MESFTILQPISSDRFFKSKSNLQCGKSFQIVFENGNYYMIREFYNYMHKLSCTQKRKLYTKDTGPYQSGNCFYIATKTLGGIKIDEKFHSYC